MEPKISIIITSWNGQKWLANCFDSLLAQNYGNYEIIFVDDGSTDNSLEFVQKNYPMIKTIRNENNFGFAKANNVGLKLATGEYVLLLNNDTTVEVDFLQKLINSFIDKPRLAIIQPKLRLMNDPEILDVCGTFWTSYGLLYHYGLSQSQALPKYNKAMPIFSGKGACLMIKKSVIDQLGLFDDDCWCYYEETDFCHRVWLAGYEVWYDPMPNCWHANGGTSTTFDNSFIQFHSAKNKLLSFLKNFEVWTLIKFLPVYFVFNIVISLAWLAQGKIKHFLCLYRAIVWNLRHLPATLKKRRVIQAMRVKTDREIAKLTKKNPRLSFYYHTFLKSNKYEDN